MNKEASKDLRTEINKTVRALYENGRSKEVLDILQDHLIEMLSDMRMGFYNKSKEESAENTATDSVSAKTNPQLEAINKAFEEEIKKQIDKLGDMFSGTFMFNANMEKRYALKKDELVNGSWFMRSATVEDRDAFQSIGLEVYDRLWGSDLVDVCDMYAGRAYPCTFKDLEESNTREIIRIGSNFFYK